MARPLTIEQARDLYARILARRESFPDEDEQHGFLVVVLNFGDHLTAVRCVAGEWTGTKAELQRHPGGEIPLCPSGHPLLEGPTHQLLGLVVT